MASDSLPHNLRIDNTSTTHGSQAFVGTNLGTINYDNSNSNSGLNDVLKTLPIAVDAPFNSYQLQHDPTCLPDTRVDLLQDIYNWAEGINSPTIFWLSGLAGTGKSTVARTVAAKFSASKALGASFFFSRGRGDAGHAGKFVATIAVQLADNIPDLKSSICNAITERSNITTLSLRDQWCHLVVDPITKLADSGQSRYIFVLDALDECENENNIGTILQLLGELQSVNRVQLKVFLTSRPEVPIRNGFIQIANTTRQDFILHNVSPSIVDHDIRIFIEHNLKLIAQVQHSLESDWPGESVLQRLIQSASGLFIWAATACRFIREGKKFAVKRLNIILENSSTDLNAAEKHLNEIYTTVLRNCFSPDFSEEEAEELLFTLKTLLGSIITLFSPLSTKSLSKLISVPLGEVDEALDELHAILDIPQDPTYPIRLHHPSFRDFLFTKTRCEEFWVDEKQIHQKLAYSCIQLMSTSLKQDICDLDAPGTPVDSVKTQVEQSLPPDVQYACLHWIQHLQKGGSQIHDNSQVHHFLKKHFLHWLEALGWMKKIMEGVYGIASLELLASTSDCLDALNFIHDAKRFVLLNYQAIEQAPLQIYCSALVFTPEASIVKRQFRDCASRWIRRLPVVTQDWDALLQTLEGHADIVSAVTFSWDGKLLASASMDETVKIWESRSGALLNTLTGHGESVKAVAFLPDGKTLASVSEENVMKLWDTGSGAVVKTLKLHSRSAQDVTFSPDGQTVASASNDGTIKLWNIRSGGVLRTFEGNSPSIIFSPDSKMLAATSYKTILLWDTLSGKVLQRLRGHSHRVTTITFSLDGKLLASASDDRTIKLWDAHLWKELQALECVSRVMSFSPDRKLLATARGMSIKLWDTVSGAALHTFGSYSDPVLAMTFSPDGKILVAASADSTVKLWDINSSPALQPLEGHSEFVDWAESDGSAAFSPDGKLFAAESGGNTIKLWDTSSRAVLHTLEGHFWPIRTMAFSSDSRTLVSVSRDMMMKLWDIDSSAALQPLEVHSQFVGLVAFSPDGKMFASESGGNTIKLWDTSSRAVLHTFEGNLNPIVTMVFSSDGKTLVLVSAERKVNLWDTNLGVELHTLWDHEYWVEGIVLSPDRKLLASISVNEVVKLWNASTGVTLRTLGEFIPQSESQYEKNKILDIRLIQKLPSFDDLGYCAVAFSPNNKMLASASDNEVMLWDINLGVELLTLSGHEDLVSVVVFSPDSKILASVSKVSVRKAIFEKRSTVKLWDVSSGAELETFELDFFAYTLSFSKDGSYLQTNSGSLPIAYLSKSEVIPSHNFVPSIFVEDQWIKFGKESILWLPVEYRSKVFANRGRVIGLGTRSGKVLFIEFAI